MKFVMSCPIMGQRTSNNGNYLGHPKVKFHRNNELRFWYGICIIYDELKLGHPMEKQ